MHVCLAIDQSFLGGGHLHLISLAKAIKARGDKVTVFSNEPGPFSAFLAENDISCYFVPMGKIPTLTKWIAWRKALRKFSPDILHLHGAIAGFWGRVGSSGNRSYRILYTIHGIQFIHRRNPLVRWGYWISEILMRSRANLILCVSESDARDAVKLKISREHQVRIVSNGISMKLDDIGKLSRSSWGIPENAFLLGCMGRLTFVKGQKYAIQAIRLLVSRYPLVHLALIGVGEDQKNLERLVRKYNLKDHVHFAGFIKRPTGALQLLDVHLMPSLWEGQGIVLMEAMLAGAPSIASNVNGIREVVRDEIEALLVPPADPKLLAAAIERLMNDPDLRKRLSENGKARVHLFDEKKTVPFILSLYHQ